VTSNRHGGVLGGEREREREGEKGGENEIEIDQSACKKKRSLW
jgi:hypothetical protein